MSNIDSFYDNSDANHEIEQHASSAYIDQDGNIALKRKAWHQTRWARLAIGISIVLAVLIVLASVVSPPVVQKATTDASATKSQEAPVQFQSQNLVPIATNQTNPVTTQPTEITNMGATVHANIQNPSVVVSAVNTIEPKSINAQTAANEVNSNTEKSETSKDAKLNQLKNSKHISSLKTRIEVKPQRKQQTVATVKENEKSKVEQVMAAESTQNLEVAFNLYGVQISETHRTAYVNVMGKNKTLMIGETVSGVGKIEQIRIKNGTPLIVIEGVEYKAGR